MTNQEQILAQLRAEDTSCLTWANTQLGAQIWYDPFGDGECLFETRDPVGKALIKACEWAILADWLEDNPTKW